MQLPAQKQGARSRLGATALGSLTILAIVSVVVFVSVPRLRSFALNENESDARYIVSLLAKELAELPAEGAGKAEDGLPLIEQLSQQPSIQQALSDGEFIADGQLLRRHGFLFRILRVDGAEGHPSSPPGTALAGSKSIYGIQAWPWRHGRTGSAALIGTDEGLLFRHENSGAKWNGPLQRSTRLSSWSGWKLLP